MAKNQEPVLILFGQLLIAICQMLAAFGRFAHHGHLSRRRYTEQKRSFPTLQVIGGRGNL
jgi:hypothetical protein